MAKLSNTVTDADGDRSNLTFEVYSLDANGNPDKQVPISDSEYGVIVSGYVASGSSAEVEVPYGKLKPGVTYAFHTSAFDGSLYETTWSPWAKFKIRGRSVDIKLPEPDANAGTVNLDAYQEPLEGRRNLPSDAAPSARGSGQGRKTCTDHGNTKTCIEVGKPSDLTKKQQKYVANQLAAGDPLVPWCSNLSVGKDYLKRTEACLKWATPIVFEYYVKAPDGGIYNPANAHFASSIEIKLDPRTRTFQQRFALVPMDPFIVKNGTLGMGGPLTMKPTFKCAPECTTSAPAWEGSPTWLPEGDTHPAYATFTHQWTGGTDTEVSSLQLDWTIAGDVEDGSTESENHPQWLGNSTPDFDVRCDVIGDTTAPEGCVFGAYKPTWVMNFKKYPAAVAHAWLIQSKLPNHPGSKTAGKPMRYLPTIGTAGWTPQDSRDVICPKNPDGTSWVSKYGNPDTTTLPENSPGDTKSCDEFAYASTYNSAGMPARFGGLNPVASGDACVQTYATRTGAGVWHLYDEIRKPAPTWQEVCGRSSMSAWMNSGSMAGFPKQFAQPNRLLDKGDYKDYYWVAFPEFAHCATGTSTVTCTVPKP